METVTIPKVEYDELHDIAAQFVGYKLAVEALAPYMGPREPEKERVADVIDGTVLAERIVIFTLGCANRAQIDSGCVAAAELIALGWQPDNTSGSYFNPRKW